MAWILGILIAGLFACKAKTSYREGSTPASLAAINQHFGLDCGIIHEPSPAEPVALVGCRANRNSEPLELKKELKAWSWEGELQGSELLVSQQKETNPDWQVVFAIGTDQDPAEAVRAGYRSLQVTFRFVLDQQDALEQVLLTRL